MKTPVVLIMLVVAVATIKESKLVDGLFCLYDEKGERVGYIKKSKGTDDFPMYDKKGKQTGLLFEDPMDRVIIEKRR